MVQEEETRMATVSHSFIRSFIHALHTLWNKFSELSPGLGARTWCDQDKSFLPSQRAYILTTKTTIQKPVAQ